MIRYKIIKHKRIPLCDYHGKCENLAYREVYPSRGEGLRKNKGWSYLCRSHFEAEKKGLGRKLTYCSLD